MLPKAEVAARHRHAPARGEAGQASLELLAGIPALIVAGLIGLQILVVGYAASLADGAVEAGAMALAAGREPGPAIEAALPGWAQARIDTEIDGGKVEITLRPPSPFDGVSKALEIDASGWVRPPAS